MAETFTITDTLPGMNEYTRANRTNFHTGSEMKRDAELVVWAGIASSRPAKSRGRVRVHFEWFEPNRRRDPDNIRTGSKFILDGMVRAGVIEGDSQRFIAGLSDGFGCDNENPRIEVTVTHE
jgi:Holliday junction resolvase RusA-like endonuclease